MSAYVGSEVSDVLDTIKGLLIDIPNFRRIVKDGRAYTATAATLAQSISDRVDTLDKQA